MDWDKEEEEDEEKDAFSKLTPLGKKMFYILDSKKTETI